MVYINEVNTNLEQLNIRDLLRIHASDVENLLGKNHIQRDQYAC